VASYQPTERRLPSRKTSLPPGVAWDHDAQSPGVLIRSVEADPFRAERCPYCRRPYESEEPPSAKEAARAAMKALLRQLVQPAGEHRTGRDLQVGRQAYLLAFYLGLLPDCHSQAQLAKSLHIDPAALSRAKWLLPPELRDCCQVHRRPRQPPSRAMPTRRPRP
jgi:hypothetical protein